MLPINFISKEPSKNKIKTLYLIDILFMKDINALYGFKNGDFIMEQLKDIVNLVIKHEIEPLFKAKAKIKFKNVYLDVFSLKINYDLDQHTIIKIKDLIFNKIIIHEFKLMDMDISINIDVTIGCSQSADDKLKIYAEKALHNAKTNYTHFMYYDSTFFKNELLSTNLINIMRDNIENKKVEPFLQPICCNKTGKVIKYEALMRLFDEDNNIISPNAFIIKSKKYRLYNKLMLILIEKVIAYIQMYKLHISINLDFHDILNPLIKNKIINKLKGTNIGNYLTIEILESEKINNFYLVNEFIQEVKKYDVKIAIDDFGTGFSNYEYILKLNVDYIKIDGSLIKRIDEKIYRNLVKSIIYFCKEQQIEVVAEFVSDLKILRYVKALEIDYSQGYYIGKPAHLDTIIGGNDFEK